MQFIVEVFWSSVSGNPCYRTSTVDAETASAAWRTVVDKVREDVRFHSLLGGNARPATTKGKHDCESAS